MTGEGELDLGMLGAGVLERCRDFHLDVPGGVEDEGHDDDPAGALRGAFETVGKQDVGVLDETDEDAPVGMAHAPEFGEGLDLGVALALARTVANEENRGRGGGMQFNHGRLLVPWPGGNGG